jgi:hypothetical protein
MCQNEAEVKLTFISQVFHIRNIKENRVLISKKTVKATRKYSRNRKKLLRRYLKIYILKKKSRLGTPVWGLPELRRTNGFS